MVINNVYLKHKENEIPTTGDLISYLLMFLMQSICGTDTPKILRLRNMNRLGAFKLSSFNAE